MLGWLVATLLLSVRFGLAIGMSPPLAAYGIPAIVRIVLILGLAVLAASTITSSAALEVMLADPGQLLTAVAGEAVVGMMIGLGAHVALSAFAVAGRLLDIQIGFGISSIFDPLTRASSNVLASLMSVLGVVLFFLSNTHLALIDLLGRSVVEFPLGGFPDFDNPMRMLAKSGLMFSVGLSLAAPVALALLLTDILVGVTSRNLPQVNVLVLSIPLKVLVGYSTLALSVSAWAPVIDTLFQNVGDILGARR